MIVIVDGPGSRWFARDLRQYLMALGQMAVLHDHHVEQYDIGPTMRASSIWNIVVPKVMGSMDNRGPAVIHTHDHNRTETTAWRPSETAYAVAKRLTVG